MTLNLNNYLKKRLIEIFPSYCKLTHALNDYIEMSALLKAAGHDTVNLDDALNEIVKSIDQLKKVQKAAIFKFESEGIDLKWFD